MIDGVYVTLIKPHIIYILSMIVGLIAMFLSGKLGIGILAMIVFIVFGVLVNCAYRSHLREKIKDEEAKSEDWRTLLHMNQTNPAIEREYIAHYTANPEEDEFEFVPLLYQPYMKREYEIWKQMGSPYAVDGVRVEMAYTFYGKARAWEAMIKDGVCRPSILDDAWVKNSYINISAEIWKTWHSTQYMTYIAQFNSSGIFESPWCKVNSSLPDWYPSQAKTARELGTHSTTT